MGMGEGERVESDFVKQQNDAVWASLCRISTPLSAEAVAAATDYTRAKIKEGEKFSKVRQAWIEGMDRWLQEGENSGSQQHP